ncbi:hypothetical protein ACFXTH_015123 [Malus domestica]
MWVRAPMPRQCPRDHQHDGFETNSSIPNNRDITVSHVTSTVADTANGNCTNKVNVPVLTTAAFEATEVSIEYAIDEGFELEIRVVEHL